MTLTALADDLGVTKQAAGRVIDDMRAAGLVSQTPDPADGRARILTLSARGLAMVDAAIEIGTAFEERVARDIGPGAARALRDALGHVVERTGAAGDLAARRVRSM
jgi:DNA-binding MarR family transcriptional regulator